MKKLCLVTSMLLGSFTVNAGEDLGTDKMIHQAADDAKEMLGELGSTSKKVIDSFQSLNIKVGDSYTKIQAACDDVDTLQNGKDEFLSALRDSNVSSADVDYFKKLWEPTFKRQCSNVFFDNLKWFSRNCGYIKRRKTVYDSTVFTDDFFEKRNSNLSNLAERCSSSIETQRTDYLDFSVRGSQKVNQKKATVDRVASSDFIKNLRNLKNKYSDFNYFIIGDYKYPVLNIDLLTSPPLRADQKIYLSGGEIERTIDGGYVGFFKRNHKPYYFAFVDKIETQRGREIFSKLRFNQPFSFVGRFINIMPYNTVLGAQRQMPVFEVMHVDNCRIESLSHEVICNPK